MQPSYIGNTFGVPSPSIATPMFTPTRTEEPPKPRDPALLQREQATTQSNI